MFENIQFEHTHLKFSKSVNMTQIFFHSSTKLFLRVGVEYQKNAESYTDAILIDFSLENVSKTSYRQKHGGKVQKSKKSKFA
jgi:hypothetical protein